MATWAFYSDSALTSAVTGLNVTADPTTFHIYFGSTTTGRKLTAQAGATGQIYVIPTDSATGSGHSKTAIKLATTSGGLSTASGGANLALGTSIVGGAVSAESIWCVVEDQLDTGALDTTLSLVLTACYESAT